VIDADLRRFRRDLLLPYSPDGAVQHTATGDLPVVAGRANLEHALRGRILASPGSLVHRAEYGAGLAEYVEVAATPAGRARIANAIRANLLRDARVREVRPTVTAGLPDDDRAEGCVTIEVAYKPQQDESSSALTLEYQP